LTWQARWRQEGRAGNMTMRPRWVFWLTVLYVWPMILAAIVAALIFMPIDYMLNGRESRR
jgi:hypothetical protein